MHSEHHEPPKNYSLILEILLMFPHFLCPEILLSTALVSKECNSLTRRAWTLLQHLKEDPIPSRLKMSSIIKTAPDVPVAKPPKDMRSFFGVANVNVTISCKK
jgi:hypothetical protein